MVKGNLAGTTNSSFKIGKTGPTVYFGSTIPTFVAENSDIYIEKSSPTGATSPDNQQIWIYRQGLGTGASAQGWQPLRHTIDTSFNGGQLTGAGEKTLYSTNIRGNLLRTWNAARVTLYGKVRNATGSSRNITFRLKYGGTTIASEVESFVSFVGDLNYHIELYLQHGILFSYFQNAHFHGQFTNAATNPKHITGIGTATSAIDSSVDQSLSFTADLPVVNPNLWITQASGFCEIVPGNYLL